MFRFVNKIRFGSKKFFDGFCMNVMLTKKEKIMQVNQVTQNHKSNLSFQQLRVKIKSGPRSLMSRAVQMALTPRRGRFNIVANASTYDIEVLESQKKGTKGKLILSVTSSKGENTWAIIPFAKRISVERFAQKMRTEIQRMRGLIRSTEAFSKTAKQVENA